MAWKYNPFTNQLDKTAEPLEEKISHADLDDMPDVGGTVTDHDTRYYTEAEVTAFLALYLKLDASNDPLTGELFIHPPGTNALKVSKNITIKAGQKLIFDG